MAKRLDVEVWSDIACPWCYIGKRRLERALRDFPAKADVALVWRAFELDPSAPRAPASTLSHHERLAKKYGVSVARAQAMSAHVGALAAEEGISFDFERIRSGSNTFDAHRLLQLAKRRGLQSELKERLMQAYFCEGAAVGDADALRSLAAGAGLDVDEVTALLAGDAYADDVRADERTAAQLGIHGVPFFHIGRYGVEGAQPVETLREALERAWSEASG